MEMKSNCLIHDIFWMTSECKFKAKWICGTHQSSFVERKIVHFCEFCWENIWLVFSNCSPSCWYHNRDKRVLLLSRQSDYLLNLIDRLLFFLPVSRGTGSLFHHLLISRGTQDSLTADILSIWISAGAEKSCSKHLSRYCLIKLQMENF